MSASEIMPKSVMTNFIAGGAAGVDGPPSMVALNFLDNYVYDIFVAPQLSRYVHFDRPSYSRGYYCLVPSGLLQYRPISAGLLWRPD